MDLEAGYLSAAFRLTTAENPLTPKFATTPLLLGWLLSMGWLPGSWMLACFVGLNLNVQAVPGQNFHNTCAVRDLVA